MHRQSFSSTTTTEVLEPSSPESSFTFDCRIPPEIKDSVDYDNGDFEADPGSSSPQPEQDFWDFFLGLASPKARDIFIERIDKLRKRGKIQWNFWGDGSSSYSSALDKTLLTIKTRGRYWSKPQWKKLQQLCDQVIKRREIELDPKMTSFESYRLLYEKWIEIRSHLEGPVFLWSDHLLTYSTIMFVSWAAYQVTLYIYEQLNQFL